VKLIPDRANESDMNATAHGQRQPLLEALRKLADVPPDTN